MSQTTIKKQIKILKKDKGIFSREIGAAKKSSLDPSKLIDEVKKISLQIHLLEASLIEQKLAENAKKPTTYQATKQVIAPQFSKQKLSVDSSQNLITQFHTDPVSWDNYVKQHNNSTIYHSWAIKQVIEKSFNHKTHYLSIINENAEIQGVLPIIELNSKLFGHSLVSIPFFNYGGMLYSNKTARKLLLSGAIKHSKAIGAEHIEFRDCFKQDDLASKENKVTMMLYFPNTQEELWSQLGTKLRAQIKKAEMNNLQVKIGRQELINDFYSVFAQNMRDLGTPVYSKQFFQHMLNQNGSANIVVIYYQQKAVSTGFVIGWKNTMEIPWASTIRSANKFGSNMKLYWEILKFALSQGYEIFDFGRSSKNTNTFRFKKQWGSTPHPLYWHYWLPNNYPLPEINPSNPKFKLFIWGWKKLPLFISNWLGPKIVKFLP